MNVALFSLLAAVSLALPQEASETRAERLARWSESIELDLFAEVVRDVRANFIDQEEFREDGDALSLYARALSNTGGMEEARALLASAQVSPESQPKVEVALARIELESDQLDAVVRRLAGGTPERPVRFAEERDAWLLLGKARQRQGDAQKAVPLLRHFVTSWRLHPEAPAAWHILAREALNARDLDTARSCREQGQNLATWHAFYKTRRIQIREKPTDPLPRYGLAQLWSSVNELERAQAALQAVLYLDPEFARAWALSGELERKSGRADAATQAYDRALALDATLGDARFNRALLALNRKDDVAARADLEIIVDGPEATAAKYLGAHLALARLLERAGESDAAKERHTRYRQLGGQEDL